jgi:hypothetical protein
VNCPLALPAAFAGSIQAGGEVGFFLTAIDPGIGFDFYSRSFAGNPVVLPHFIVSATARPGITAIGLSGTNLVVSATNGIAGGTYFVLTSTNLTSPASQWTPVATNVLAAGGNFASTVPNAVITNSPLPHFFVLSTF